MTEADLLNEDSKRNLLEYLHNLSFRCLLCGPVTRIVLNKHVVHRQDVVWSYYRRFTNQRSQERWQIWAYSEVIRAEWTYMYSIYIHI